MFHVTSDHLTNVEPGVQQEAHVDIDIVIDTSMYESVLHVLRGLQTLVQSIR